MRELLVLLLMGIVLVVKPLAVWAVEKEPVRHVVVFKYKQGTTEEQIRQVTNAFSRPSTARQVCLEGLCRGACVNGWIGARPMGSGKR